MINKGTKRLITIRKLNLEDKNYINTRLYPLLYETDLWRTAYKKIKSDKGIRKFTHLVGAMNLNGLSLKRIEKNIQELKSESWKPKSVKNPKYLLSPGHIIERIVQEIIYEILASIYEPSIINERYKFQSNQNCHIALKRIKQTFQDINWTLTGTLIDDLDPIHYLKLIQILRKRIRDERFLNLIQKLLRAGYLRENDQSISKYKLTFPQQKISLRIFKNLYLSEFDQRILDHKKQWENQGKNIRSQELKGFINQLKKSSSNRISRVIRLNKLKLESLNSPYSDKRYKKLKVEYLRYSNNWIIGISGPKSLVYKIHKSVIQFLIQELKLNISNNQILITDIQKNPTRFLGYNLQLKLNPKVKKIKLKKGKKFLLRTRGFRLKLMIPMRDLIKHLKNKGFCNEYGFPIAKLQYTSKDDFEIVRTYKRILQDINDYYSGVSYQNPLYQIDYILRYSCAKTLAHKHKSTCSKMFKKYGKELRIMKNIKQFKNRKGSNNEVRLPIRKFKNKLAHWKISSKIKDF